jgi:hypothetical protein
MGETSQIQVCQAFTIIPKKTQGYKRWQRFFNKVLSKGSEYLCKYNISGVVFLGKKSKSKSVFALSLWGIVLRLMI